MIFLGVPELFVPRDELVPLNTYSDVVNLELVGVAYSACYLSLLGSEDELLYRLFGCLLGMGGGGHWGQSVQLYRVSA